MLHSTSASLASSLSDVRYEEAAPSARNALPPRHDDAIRMVVVSVRGRGRGRRPRLRQLTVLTPTPLAVDPKWTEQQKRAYSWLLEHSEDTPQPDHRWWPAFPPSVINQLDLHGMPHLRVGEDDEDDDSTASGGTSDSEDELDSDSVDDEDDAGLDDVQDAVHGAQDAAQAHGTPAPATPPMYSRFDTPVDDTPALLRWVPLPDDVRYIDEPNSAGLMARTPWSGECAALRGTMHPAMTDELLRRLEAIEDEQRREAGEEPLKRVPRPSLAHCLITND